jgi:hypothetical protein
LSHLICVTNWAFDSFGVKVAPLPFSYLNATTDCIKDGYPQLTAVNNSTATGAMKIFPKIQAKASNLACIESRVYQSRLWDCRRITITRNGSSFYKVAISGWSVPS